MTVELRIDTVTCAGKGIQRVTRIAVESVRNQMNCLRSWKVLTFFVSTTSWLAEGVL